MKSKLKPILTITMVVFIAGCLSRATIPEPIRVDGIHQIESIRMKIKDRPELDFYLNYKDGMYVKEPDGVLTYRNGATVDLGYFADVEILSIERNIISIKYRISHQVVEGWQSAGCGTSHFIRIPTIRQHFIESSRRLRFAEDEWIDLIPKETSENFGFPGVQLRISTTEQARGRQSG